MQLSEFLDHLKFRNYELIENFLDEQILEQKIIEKDFVEALSIQSFKFFSESFKVQFCEHLFKNSSVEDIVRLIPKLEDSKNNFKLSLLRIRSLWELGQVALYFEEIKFLLESLAFNKAYSGLTQVILSEADRIKNKDFYILSLIQLHLDQNNIIAIIKTLKELREGFLDETSVSLETVSKVYTLLELSEVNDYRLLKEKLFYKLTMSLNEETLLLEKEMIETLLYCETKQEFLLLSHFVSEFTFEHFAIFLKNNLKITSRDFPKRLKSSHIKEKLTTSITSEINEIKEMNEAEEGAAGLVEYDYKGIKETVNQETAPKVYYTKTDDENRLLRFLQIINEEKYFCEEMAISFFELRYFTVSEYIIRNLPRSSNKYYLQGLINLKLENFPSAIMHANYALENFLIEGEERLPFEVIKAVAFKNLGEMEELQKIKSFIKTIDPNVNLDAKMWRL